MTSERVNSLLLDVKQAVLGASEKVLGFDGAEKSFRYDRTNPREVKAVADKQLEFYLLEALGKTGIAILSEESGFVSGNSDPDLRLIIDPLDGTFNFVKGLGECAISVALWRQQMPVFGVIYSISSGRLYWGGADFGAWYGENELRVSRESNISKSAICTGFPVRQNLAGSSTMKTFWDLVVPFSKVRMLGSAASSLMHVADGSAEVYSEGNIMLWDVAAGLAIVEGAGGHIFLDPGTEQFAYDIRATNALINI